MCIYVKRLCPGCNTETEHSELKRCDKRRACRKPYTYNLPLRREDFSNWDCPTDGCPFNDEHLQDLERKYLLDRVARTQEDVSKLTAEERKIIKESSSSEDSDSSDESDDSDNSEDEDEAEAADPQPVQRRPRIRATDKIEVETLPAHIQTKIAALLEAITKKRPPAAKHSQRSTRKLRKAEKWLKEEDSLLLFLRNLGFGYNQIADEILKWRHRNPLEKRVGHLQKQQGRKQKKKKARQAAGSA